MSSSEKREANIQLTKQQGVDGKRNKVETMWWNYEKDNQILFLKYKNIDIFVADDSLETSQVGISI
jgi:hypothetical protein